MNKLTLANNLKKIKKHKRNGNKDADTWKESTFSKQPAENNYPAGESDISATNYSHSIEELNYIFNWQFQ